ncbi:MAG: LysM peptidoglycan-binding domain-containing protein, partial [Candidatus Thiodiazotropha endolucinida]
MKDSVNNIQDFAKHLTIILFILSLSACVAMGPQQQPEPVQAEPQEEVETIPTPPDSLTPSQRVRKALQQLEQGDYENARLQLAWALQEKPTLQIATNLLEQMDADPIDYLGMKSFFYDVEPGDSLSIIAKKFLNDPLKFVILARYNKLENPSKLAPGQRIRVPGVMPERKKPKPKPKTPPPEPAPVVQEIPESTPDEETTVTPDLMTGEVQIEEPSLTMPEGQAPLESEEPLQPPVELAVEEQPAAMTAEEALSTAMGLHAEGNLSAAIYLLENQISQLPNAQELPKLLAGYYNEHADQLINRGDLDNARTILEKLIILDSSDDAAINKLILVEDKIEAQKVMRAAQEQLTAGNLEEAYQTYNQVLTYDPDNSAAQASQL